MSRYFVFVWLQLHSEEISCCTIFISLFVVIVYVHSVKNRDFISQSLLAFSPSAMSDDNNNTSGSTESDSSLTIAHPAQEVLAKITLASVEAQKWITQKIKREFFLLHIDHEILLRVVAAVSIASIVNVCEGYDISFFDVLLCHIHSNTDRSLFHTHVDCSCAIEFSRSNTDRWRICC